MWGGPPAVWGGGLAGLTGSPSVTVQTTWSQFFQGRRMGGVVLVIWEGSIEGLAFSQGCKQRLSKFVSWAEGNQFGVVAGQLEGSAFDLLRCRRRFDHPLCSITHSGVVPTPGAPSRAVYHVQYIPHAIYLVGVHPLIHRLQALMKRGSTFHSIAAPSASPPTLSRHVASASTTAGSTT